MVQALCLSSSSISADCRNGRTKSAGAPAHFEGWVVASSHCAVAITEEVRFVVRSDAADKAMFTDGSPRCERAVGYAW